MRWMWIDRIVELVPGTRAVAIKNVSMAEDHLHDHFPARDRLCPMPIMPASLILEGVAQTAGILVGHSVGFKEKVVLAKIGAARVERDVPPGYTLRYTAMLQQSDAAGAATTALIEARESASDGGFERIGSADLLFSFVDRNMAGASFPAHNFVFTESFRTLLTLSGIAADF